MRTFNIKWLRTLRIIFLLFLLIGFVSVILLSQVCFQSIPENSAVRQVYVSELGQAFFVTEDYKLYVGGQNRDHLGFYRTGFRWGLLYGLRNLVSEKPPVLFADQVCSVYKAEDGVLFSDIDGALYYFGEKNGGKKDVLAESVKKASQSSFAITYLSTDSTAYAIGRDYQSDTWTPPQKLADDVIDLAVEGNCVWLHQEDGHVLRIPLRYGGMPDFNEKNVIAENVEKMWTSRSMVLLQTSDSTYQVVSCDDSKIISIQDLTVPVSNADNNMKIIDADLKAPYPGNYFLTEKGGIYKIENSASVFQTSLQKEEAAGITIGYDYLYVIFGDGSYQRIALSEAP